MWAYLVISHFVYHILLSVENKQGENLAEAIYEGIAEAILSPAAYFIVIATLLLELLATVVLPCGRIAREFRLSNVYKGTEFFGWDGEQWAKKCLVEPEEDGIKYKSSFDRV